MGRGSAVRPRLPATYREVVLSKSSQAIEDAGHSDRDHHKPTDYLLCWCFSNAPLPNASASCGTPRSGLLAHGHCETAVPRGDFRHPVWLQRPLPSRRTSVLCLLSLSLDRWWKRTRNDPTVPECWRWKRCAAAALSTTGAHRLKTKV